MAKKQAENKEKITALYCRLSVEDMREEKGKKGSDESNSISNQRTILAQYARDHGYLHPQFFVDDGISGTTFDRPGFKKMQEMVEAGEIGTIIVKDLSRFGREQVEMGRLLQFVYPSLGVTFIAIQENVNTTEKTGLEMMPFYNISMNGMRSRPARRSRPSGRPSPITASGYPPPFLMAIRNPRTIRSNGALMNLQRRWCGISLNCVWQALAL